MPELIVSDFARSFKFYTQVIGFQQLYGRPEDGFAFLDRNGAQLMIDQRSPTPERDWVAAALEYPFGRGMNLEIEVEDANALHANCLLQGAKIFFGHGRKMVPPRCRAPRRAPVHCDGPGWLSPAVVTANWNASGSSGLE